MKRWLASVFVVGFNAVTQVLGFVILARYLGPAEFAAIVAVSTVTLVSNELVGFGTMDLIVRSTSRDGASYPQALAQALALTACSLIPILAGSVAVVHVLFGAYQPLWVLALLVLGEVIFARGIVLVERLAIAHDEVERANFYRLLTGSCRFIAILLACLVAGVSTASAWAGWYLLAAAGSIAACMVHAIIRYGRPARFVLPPWQEWGIAFSAVQMLRGLQQSLDKLIVAATAGEAVLGIYGAASRLAQFSTLPALAISRITYPRFFSHGARGVGSAASYARGLIAPTLAVGIFAAAGVAAASFVIEPLLGQAYEGTGDYLLLLCLLPLFSALQNLAGDVLTGSDRQPYRVGAFAVGVTATALCAWAGLYMAGISGVAVGFVIGLFITMICTTGAVIVLARRAEQTT